jgi:hypothetical protein
MTGRAISRKIPTTRPPLATPLMQGWLNTAGVRER